MIHFPNALEYLIVIDNLLYHCCQLGHVKVIIGFRRASETLLTVLHNVMISCGHVKCELVAAYDPFRRFWFIFRIHLESIILNDSVPF